MSNPNKRIKLEDQTKENDDDDDLFGDDFDLDELNNLSTLLNKHDDQLKPKDLSVTFDDIPLNELENIFETNTRQNTAETLVPDEPRSLEMLSGPTAVGTESQQKEPVEKRKKFTRYSIADITEGNFEMGDRTFTEKILLLLQEDQDACLIARLRDDWLQTTVAIGNVVHIPTTRSETSEVIIDQKQNFIVVHPDRLISCTTVASSYQCLRRSIFQAKVRGVSDYSEALVHGNIIHRVVQNVLQTGDFSVQNIKEEMKLVIQSSLEELYALDRDEKTTMEVLGEYAESIHQFGSVYVGAAPKPRARVSTDMGSDAVKQMGCDRVAISKVLDIEEHLWSPTYGLKGMIDASIQLKLSPINRVLTVPFELKTGRTSKFLENRAQTVLYTLLMSDRYDIDIGAGVLYYSKTNSLYLVPAARNELVSLIVARNALACALSTPKQIPEMIKNFHMCQYCYVNDVCTVYHKTMENGTNITSGLHKLFDDKTEHITSKMTSFFKHWWELLGAEETDIDYIRKDIWSQTAQVREMSGRCLSNLKLNLAESDINPETAEWRYCFVRDDSEKSLLCDFSVGDPVVVSSMEGHINLAMGQVSRISSESIVLNLNGLLRNPPKPAEGIDVNNNQDFDAFIRHTTDVNQLYKNSQVRYRVDQDEIATSMAMLRNNLVQLVVNKEEERKKELIINLKKPEFDNTILPKNPINPQMNMDQRNVLTKVLQAKDYNLILGMPGTGKTTTTAEIIKYLVGMNKTILVTAFTHTALDNVLCKVRDQGIDVLRLGNIDRVMQSMKDCVPVLNNTLTTVEQMKQFYDSKKVVGVTCLGIGHFMLQKRHFDYCVIDEASQITLPMCIGPIRYADKFVLVGDLYQLPPIVQNPVASKNGLNKSLFAILAEAHPESVSKLEHQYRMNDEIMQVANTMVYDGKLKCGNHSVSTQSLMIPHLKSGLEAIHKLNKTCPYPDTSCWISEVLDPQ
ncbi:hypothetical protein G6F56_006464 [Rhizopus delemar]|uniref:DNA replication ATP-dependent helicase/nuclease DNA2 n=1 Tax=Rhizopus stolonifer TaxID=4846 RepID=A0A367JIX7_RHIST|nr:hypothetical protein G6F56_006464 [Rhizopus delemar]RCH89904.1 Tripartite DNA replication factor [Rhizopus stolonifer]